MMDVPNGHKKGIGVMEKVEKVKAAVTEKGKIVAKKAKDLKEIALLKSQIFTCEEVIRKNSLEIGRLVYEEYEEHMEAEENGENFCQDELEEKGVLAKKEEGKTLRRFEKQCVAIANAKRAVADLKKRIREIQGK